SVLIISIKAEALEIRWNDESRDTIFINSALTDARKERFDDAGARVEFFARRFIGKPYKGHTLEGEREWLTINTDYLDCTTFVDMALALAKTSYSDTLTKEQTAYNLENMRYRNGQSEDYASRLHYNSDWACDNIMRANITDVTPDIYGCRYLTRNLNFMSTHRSLYPALSDKSQFEKIVEIEKNYIDCKIPYIPTASISNPKVLQSLKEGDIIGFATGVQNLDMAHLGIIVMQKGVPFVLHASSSHGKVEISRLPLPEFVKNNKKWVGIRVFRLNQPDNSTNQDFTSQIPFCRLFQQMISAAEHYISALLP
ncbi:MAG: DUF1460 domain-containing protein, partial [Muribaculaceae bacterium]|nr:DUF1460 domain-containing protein [Muribaculaceae bacterium]